MLRKLLIAIVAVGALASVALCAGYGWDQATVLKDRITGAFIYGMLALFTLALHVAAIRLWVQGWRKLGFVCGAAGFLAFVMTAFASLGGLASRGDAFVAERQDALDAKADIRKQIADLQEERAKLSFTRTSKAGVDAAVDAMNELFNALLDISKLDAGVLMPDVSEFPVEHLLKRIVSTFTTAAREKGLQLRVVGSRAWVRSDFILLERILLNLVSNAVRYTARGGVVVGCRRHHGRLRIDVCDSGIGIPEDQQRNIFGEFYRLAGPDRGRTGGLGLGLAIVDRLCRLLDHQIELSSRLGRGSRFSVSVPLAPVRCEPVALSISPTAIADPTSGKLVVVIDDDALVLEGMRGLLRSWGCQVVTAESDQAALARLASHDRRPDLIISDYRLADGDTGFEVIKSLRSALRAPIPAFLITGDTAPERLREANASGFHLLHKPVSPMALRALLNQLMKDQDDAGQQAQVSIS